MKDKYVVGIYKGNWALWFYTSDFIAKDYEEYQPLALFVTAKELVRFLEETREDEVRANKGSNITAEDIPF